MALELHVSFNSILLKFQRLNDNLVRCRGRFFTDGDVRTWWQHYPIDQCLAVMLAGAVAAIIESGDASCPTGIANKLISESLVDLQICNLLCIKMSLEEHDARFYAGMEVAHDILVRRWIDIKSVAGVLEKKGFLTKGEICKLVRTL